MRSLAELLSESTLSMWKANLLANPSWRRMRIRSSLPQRAFTDEQAPLTKDPFHDDQDWADEIDAQDPLTAVECYESIMIVDQE
jgi:hypothetical protein